MNFIMNLKEMRKGVHKMDNKYISKALLYDERKIIVGSMLAYSFLYLINILIFLNSLPILRNRADTFSSINSLDEHLKFLDPYLTLANIPYIPLAAICLIAIYQSYDHKDVRYSFMLTQPYSRDSIVISKSAASIIGYTVPMAVYGLLSILLLSLNKDIYGVHLAPMINMILTNLFFAFVMLTLMVSVLQLSQMLFGKNNAAFFMPPALIFIFAISLGAMTLLSSKYIPYLRNILDALGSCFFGSYVIIGSKEYPSLASIIIDYLNNPTLIPSIAILALAGLITYLCIILNRRVKAENTSGLFMFKFTEVLYKIILSLFFVVMATLLILLIVLLIYKLFTGNSLPEHLRNTLGSDGAERTEEFFNLAANIAWIPMFAFAYKLIGRFLNRDNSSKKDLDYQEGRTA